MPTYVVLVNERPESRAALDWTLKLVATQPSAIAKVTLHVVLGPGTDIPGGPRYVSPTLSTDVANQLDVSGVRHDLYSEAADPVHRVITLAEDVRADLVVIGLQKRSATLKLFIGSHARDILVDAPCPVVAVKE
jgi:nucleotide-binding universal stress UspA family protein